MQHRLCLVAVKCFPENTYFSEMLISGKGKCFHVFGCISKNFPENIFWCLEKKKENTNPKNTSHNPEKKSSTIAIWDREIAPSIMISIDGAISRTRDHGRWTGAREIGADWSSRFAGDCRIGLELGLLPLARLLSLSLSFSENTLKWKWKCKMISVVKAIFFRSTEINFRKILFFGPTKHPHCRKSISGSDFHPKQTHPKNK